MTEVHASVDSPAAEQPRRPAEQRSLAQRRWSFWKRRTLTPREGQLFLLLAILIGAFSGMAVVCFRIAIEWTRLLPLADILKVYREA